MNGRGINYNFAGFSNFEAAISRVNSAITNYFKQFQVEQAEIKHQLARKRQAQVEYHQEMVDGMPLLEMLRNGNHHF